MRLLTRMGAAGLALYLAGPVAVGLRGLGVPFPLVIVLSVGALGAGATVLVRRMPQGSDSRALRPALVAAWIVLLVAAVFQVTRLSVFMHDVKRVSYSVLPDDPWRLQHSCLTAYAEAARFVSGDTDNVYDAELYENRRLGPLRVDTFHYPPPFLLLPAAVRVIAVDYFSIRRIWFALQSVLLVSALLWIALWIGGAEGRLAAAATVVVLAAPQTVFTLQIGNFQVTAICAAMMATALIASGRIGVGSSVLAFVTAGKIFPGVLGVYLSGARQWRAVLTTAVCGLVFTAVAGAAFGANDFSAFFGYELPRIVSGEAFPQAERPFTMVPNQSVYGLVTKVRSLGATGLDQAVTLQIAAAYGYLVIAVSLLLGLTRARFAEPAPGRDRLEHAQLWLALLNLASFRSPFVGAGYGSVGTVWLLSLLIVGARTRARRALWVALTVCLFTFMRIVQGPLPGTVPTAAAFAVSAAFDVLLLLTNFSVVGASFVRALRARKDSSRAIATV